MNEKYNMKNIIFYNLLDINKLSVNFMNSKI